MWLLIIMLYCLLNFIKKVKLFNYFVFYLVYIWYLLWDYNMDEILWDSFVSSSKVLVNVVDCSLDWMLVWGGGGKKYGCWMLRI